MITIKHLPNLITSIRILCSLMLLALKPLSSLFMFVYLISGLSDMLDGFIARKWNCSSKKGALLDSIADFIFTFAVIIMFIPIIRWEGWMIMWIGFIIVIRLCSLVIGFIKYRSFAFLHTYSNKAAGFVIFCFPFLLSMLNLKFIVSVLCFIASLSAIEELIINLLSKKLLRDIKSVFELHN